MSFESRQEFMMCETIVTRRLSLDGLMIENFAVILVVCSGVLGTAK